MKRLLLLPLLLGAALAHEVVTAGPVSVQWHTDAGEGARVNDETLLSFALWRHGEPLDMALCRCTVLLYPGEPSPRVRPTVLAVQALSAEWLPLADGHTHGVVLKLPASGRYTAVLDGRPHDGRAFDPFRLNIVLHAAPPEDF